MEGIALGAPGVLKGRVQPVSGHMHTTDLLLPELLGYEGKTMPHKRCHPAVPPTRSGMPAVQPSALPRGSRCRCPCDGRSAGIAALCHRSSANSLVAPAGGRPAFGRGGQPAVGPARFAALRLLEGLLKWGALDSLRPGKGTCSSARGRCTEISKCDMGGMGRHPCPAPDSYKGTARRSRAAGSCQPRSLSQGAYSPQ